MNFNDLNIFENEDLEFREDEFQFKSAFPLFNFEALRSCENELPALNLLNSQRVSEIVGEIIAKKVKTNQNTEVQIRKRGRKAIAKNAKTWDDPTITMKEIIENDLAGTPMEAEIKMKEERLRKIREKKNLRKAERELGATNEKKAIENETNTVAIVQNALNIALEPLVAFEDNFAPQIAFKDGKIVIDTSSIALRRGNEKKLIVVENVKPRKVTSMSFRTKNQAAKWTEQETRKFFKGIEIFGADFSLIAKLFPTRNRDQIKNKFNKEEKVNAMLIDEAFKKNSTLGKRSIFERIRNFSRNFNNIEENVAEFDLETGGFAKLERNFSTSSTDSMDYKIMEEIQEIFVKEIKPRNNVTNTLAILNNSVIEGPFEIAENESVNDENEKEYAIKEEKEVKKNNNLLARFMN